MKGAIVVVKILSSLKTELKILAITFATLILLPVMAAVALVDAPLQAVSDALAWVNPVSHKVEFREGAGIRELDVETTWPVRGSVTQEFGHPNPPYETSHSGIDIGAPQGTPIGAAMAGKVIRAGLDSTGGLSVDIDHGHGITTHYAHLSVVLTSANKEVKIGEVIGQVGHTGWAFGDHLHFGVRVAGLLVNPRVFMVGNPPPLQ